MDAGLAAIIGAAVGALGAVGAGLVGLLAPLGLEKRQLEKDRRKELQAEIAGYSGAVRDWALRYGTRTKVENAEVVAGAIEHQARIALNLRSGEGTIVTFMNASLNAALKHDDARLPVAVATFDLLPKWYRGEASLGDVEKKTGQIRELARLLATGAPHAAAAAAVAES